MNELWVMLKVESSARVAFLLDASESTQQPWQHISSLARDLIEALPATAQLRVFFLGNPQAYHAAEFS